MRAAPCLHSVLRRSVQVDYYDKAPVKDGKAKDGTKAKSRGVFDLREVEALSKPTDPTAPDWCVMVQVEKHRFVLDFGYKGERNAWLRIWCNAVPSLAISKEWQAEFVDEAMAGCMRVCMHDVQAVTKYVVWDFHSPSKEALYNLFIEPVSQHLQRNAELRQAQKGRRGRRGGGGGAAAAAARASSCSAECAACSGCRNS